MVYYFSSAIINPPAEIYVGKDKVENEELIKYGWEEDIWFHADNLSSAHIYLRLTEGQTWDALPTALIEDCAQLTKANSIEGNKRDNVTVIYTPWSNLKKDGSMAMGQVSFHSAKMTKRILIPKRENAIINRLTKTRTEIAPPLSTQHLRDAKEAHLAVSRKVVNEVEARRRKEEAGILKQKREEKIRGEADWNALVGSDRVEEEGVSNEDGWREDDFM